MKLIQIIWAQKEIIVHLNTKRWVKNNILLIYSDCSTWNHITSNMIEQWGLGGYMHTK